MNPDLYVVLVNDRHADPETHLFTDDQVAVAHARAEALKIARGDASRLDEQQIEDWTLFIGIEPESDYVRVQQVTVNAELKS